jgi:hypothetical protein
VAVVVATVFSDRLFTHDEKLELLAGWNHGVQRLRDVFRRCLPAAPVRDT